MDTLRVLIGTGQAVDLASPLFRTPAEVTLRPLSDPVDSLFLLLCRRDLDADLAEGVVAAVRRWYVAGLEEFGSPWLARVLAPTASPTLRAAAATARRSRPGAPAGAGADPARA
jgi:hypothetical protein